MKKKIQPAKIKFPKETEQTIAWFEKIFAEREKEKKTDCGCIETVKVPDTIKIRSPYNYRFPYEAGDKLTVELGKDVSATYVVLCYEDMPNGEVNTVLQLWKD